MGDSAAEPGRGNLSIRKDSDHPEKLVKGVPQTNTSPASPEAMFLENIVLQNISPHAYQSVSFPWKTRASLILCVFLPSLTHFHFLVILATLEPHLLKTHRSVITYILSQDTC